MSNIKKDNDNKRNISYEIIMVIFGTFLIILSFISVNMSVENSLNEQDARVVDNACTSMDAFGNYDSDEIQCISHICYLKKEDKIISANCESKVLTNITTDRFNIIKEKYSDVKNLCNKVNEEGVYLDQLDNNCIDGICSIKDKEMEYQYECPNIVAVNDEDQIDNSTKDSLKELCTNYKNGQVIKDVDELYECNYGSCSIMNEKNHTTYSLNCDKNIYKVMDEDQVADSAIINKYLDMSCNNKNITEKRFKENIRCSKGICSFHYKQEDYFKKCDK